jgi:hypothetical protein
MNASQINEAALAELGRGNTVGPRETLKTQLGALLDRLDHHDKRERQIDLGSPQKVDIVVDGLRQEIEGLLEVAFPLIEYGGEAGQAAVANALARVAAEVGRDTSTPGWENAVLVVSTHLLLATTAFALACDAAEFLPRLLRVNVRFRNHEREEPLLDARRARYLAAYEGDAGRSFEAHRRWMESLGVVETCYPLLVRDDEIVKALMEADMLFALHTLAAGVSREPYAHSIGRDGHYPETRLRARVSDPRQRAAVVAFYALADYELESHLTRLYAQIRRDPDLWGDEHALFDVDETPE